MSSDTPALDRAALGPSRVLAGFETQAWVQLVLGSLARETNTLLPSTHFLLVGEGAIIDGLTAALTRLGARVRVASDDPIALLDLTRRYPISVSYPVAAQFVSADVDVVVSTGPYQSLTAAALAPGERTLIVVDAAVPGETSAPYTGDIVGRTRSLTEYAGPRPVFVVPRVQAEALDRAGASVRARYAALLRTVGPDHADFELAKALLS